MKFFIGVDGGGTSTRVALANIDGEILSIGKSGASSIDTVSGEVTGKHISEALQRCLEKFSQKYKEDIEEIECCFASLGGVDSEKDKEYVVNIVKEYTGNILRIKRVVVENDTRAALAGGLAEKSGVIFIVGTGAVCFGINENMESWKSGGWGYKIDDFGSGFYLGREALTMMVKCMDGREEDEEFKRVIKNAIGINSLSEVSERLYKRDFNRTDIARIAPEVLRLAEKKNKIALNILDNGADELTLMMKSVCNKLNIKNGKYTALGGVIEGCEIYRNKLIEKIKDNVDVEYSRPYMSAIGGAVLLSLYEVIGEEAYEFTDAIRRSLAKN
ncbi:N-acetylglucosamine kinase [Oceanirhabdus sp. W0125-5]|uniref:N-acetylglucosamine kinase n=1 Tax=Oceanirhabdus sp. W0125-5 TaxID=2999116 RepID=UPI0022F2CBB3|nr:BadF/BadG/BcrA/BcrD ATPase family protein [Oceanirhabdus sp. W0125-5]WBW94770.1 BadF/BadG/BcrA/BcrD ATPase family protein [Oceanirhabdus sp. W0125-5]